MSQLFKRFRRDITGLLWLATGIFLALSLFSYNPADPSFNSIGKNLKAHNFCGYFGSFLSDLMYQLLGISAWILVLGSLRLAARCFRGHELAKGHLRLVWALLLLVTCSGLLALYFPEVKIFQQQVYIGGFAGLILAKSLVTVFNFAGVAVILWTLAAVLVVFYTEKPINDIFKSPVQVVSAFWARLRTKLTIKAKQRPIPVETTAKPTPSPVKGPLFALKKKPSVPIEEKPVKEDAFFPIADGVAEGETVEPVKRRKVNLKKAVERKIENWELPKLALLEDPPMTRARVDDREIREKAQLLVNKLAQFDVKGEVTGVRAGPAVTLFEFKPNADVKISKITDLADDLSLALSSESVRIIAPIPGRDVVGIETSNSVREAVYLKDILADEQFWEEDSRLPLALGRQANGKPKVVDLRKMPHLLVAGTTGSGKSVFVVSTLVGLLFRHSPKTLRLILVDPKQVDLAAFSKVPHLLMPPVREPKKAIGALKWAIREMEKRYRSMSKFGARGLESFNDIVTKFSADEVKEHETIHEELTGAAKLDDYYFTPQPYIVIVVEEFGDLMAVDKANVEQAVVRLAQMARACGIHLILAMQSPRKDVVTGLIKTNIPGRISFKVASKMDSRIILDESGAERLLTRGDMLFLAPGFSKPERHHGPWLTEGEISSVTRAWSAQAEPQYDVLAMRALEGSGGGFDLSENSVDSFDGFDEEGMDDRYDEILAYVSSCKEVSASLLQRKFRLGYPRAARLIEIFEQEGVVGPANGSKPRQVLVSELK